MGKNKNPFKEGSTSYKDFEKMSDLKWHCVKCELLSGQAKTWQVWRQNGIQLDLDDDGKFYKKIYCDNCGIKTVHRKLKSLQVLEDTKSRSGLPAKLARVVKELYFFKEAVFLREMPSKELEVDHRFPQVRWGSDEKKNEIKMSEAEIKNKFILLSRSNNLLKSRHCENCVKNDIRGSFPGIYFWYKGGENWDKDIDMYNEKGCEGCFWHDPYKWRDELNKIVKKKQC